MPLYSEFIRERFERCLDLYLAPRARRMRLHVPSPEALLPQLPKPRDLQPFPTTLLLKYLGHVGKVWTGRPGPLCPFMISPAALALTAVVCCRTMPQSACKYPAAGHHSKPAMPERP